MSDRNLLQVTDVSLFYNKFPVIDNVSMSIAKGDFIALIGPNGAGKTSLLKILLGIKKADRGRVSRRAGLRIGYMPQDLNLNLNIPLTVRRFLMLGYPKKPADIEETARLTAVYNLLDNQLRRLSSGQRQKVLLCRTLLGKPDLLILDEPGANMDVSGEQLLYKLLADVHRSAQQTAIVMVSHNLHLVMANTTHVICLFHHVCCSGKPQMVTRNPAFAELFDTDTAALMGVYQHSHNHSHHQIAAEDETPQ